MAGSLALADMLMMLSRFVAEYELDIVGPPNLERNNSHTQTAGRSRESLENMFRVAKSRFRKNRDPGEFWCRFTE